MHEGIITNEVPKIGDRKPFNTRKGTIYFIWDGRKWVDAPKVIPTVKEKTLDLGDILGDVNKILDIKDRLFPTTGPQITTPAFFPEIPLGDFGGLGIPGADLVPNPPANAGCGGSAVYKKVCGAYKWVFPKRRRRKQLVTKSDAQGLATLKGIVGNGVVMQTWIATHA